MNHSNCATCDHKLKPDGGWCYMFKREPQETCKQHTGNFQRFPKAEDDALMKRLLKRFGER